METKFNFKSQICTDIIQSERLLSLGLKKETADMVLCKPFDCEKHKYSDGCVKIVLEEEEDLCKDDIPAWSLHRLLCMIPNILRAEKPFENSFSSLMNIMISTLGIAYYYEDYDENRIYEFECFENLMEASVSAIEWLIKEGYFNKEYLV